MINRRRFLQTLVAASAASARTGFAAAKAGKLAADPNGILDLPPGFEYQLVSAWRDEMDDGLLVPGSADGMAAFPGNDGQVVLVCNHENVPNETRAGPWGPELERLDSVSARLVYDYGHGRAPGNGGTSTIVYDPRNRSVIRRNLSLAGTELNCSGGPTPWGSWLSCEECFKDPGSSFESNRVVSRAQRHGYIFEVPCDAEGLVDPVPLKAMGRFEHEAAAISPATGIVYMTEDRHRSLFYRFLPKTPGRLADGGQLQALVVKGTHGLDTRNWDGRERIAPQREYQTMWIDLDDVDSDSNDLRLRGREKGAAIFARGEGACIANNQVAFACTIGGPDRLGQIFVYTPGPYEGQAGENLQPGSLLLLSQASQQSLLRNADNLVMSPWGDLIVCEDTADHCGLVGVRQDGSQYLLADNAYSSSELAGVCFSPDGSTMFVNVQYPGKTLAITGPWSDLYSSG
jgi:secreted PhoX family phosphatase